MLFSNRRLITVWSSLIGSSLLFLLSACGGSGANTDTGNLQIMVVAPAGMAADTLVIHLLDQADQPVTDAKVTVEGNMNHAGMAPVLTDPVTDEADGATDGHYQLPFTFSMLGDWILTVTVDQADGTTVTKDIEVSVTDAGITGDAAVVVPASMDHSTMDHSTMDHSTMAHSTMASGEMNAMMVSNAMARAVPIADGNGAIYFMLTNGTAIDDQLLTAESNVANAAEFHETINDNNVMRMEARPDGFALPAGESLLFEPGGKHVMLVGLHEPLVEGDTFTVTLSFAHAAPLTVEVPVMAIDADMDHNMDTMDMGK